jgi:membrane protease subunit HflC
VAQRQAVEITAAARRDSEVIRGEGDAERNAIFADAYQRDPEFFSFVRSLRAYEKSLGANDTTYVLNPTSDFFRYFSQETNQ